MNRDVTLITMAAGNPKAFLKTLESTKGVVSEIIFGSLIIFKEDRELIEAYQKEYNLKIFEYPFEFIFKNGFSAILNSLAIKASNDLIMYLNVSEIISEGKENVLQVVNDNPNCDCFYFDHKSESHRWFRTYDRTKFSWSGLIHEEIQGDGTPYHLPLFTMADEEKDLDSEFKSKVLNDIKEIVYWNQLIRIADNPELLSGTSIGWLQFAKDGYTSMKERLSKKGNRQIAFEKGELEIYLNDIYTNPEFEKERFASNNMIGFQGDKIHLL